MDTSEQEFSFKRLFVPLTTFKAIHIIVILGFIVFGNTLFNNFVQDDKTYIINDPLTHVVDLAVWFGDNSFSHGGQYRSLPAVYFSITYNIFGTTPFFYHLLQVSLHITCVILLYFLFHKFFSPGLSLFLCLVFLVHPINVESVSYIAQTVNPLFFLFGIIPLLLVTKKNIHNKDIIIACTLLLLSMFTKETGILFLLLLLIYSFFYAKNIL